MCSVAKGLGLKGGIDNRGWQPDCLCWSGDVAAAAALLSIVAKSANTLLHLLPNSLASAILPAPLTRPATTASTSPASRSSACSLSVLDRNPLSLAWNPVSLADAKLDDPAATPTTPLPFLR